MTWMDPAMRTSRVGSSVRAELLGAPNPNLDRAMLEEHCHAADSHAGFTSDNYGVHTTSEIEWLYVVEPSAPSVPVALGRLRYATWPQHARTAMEADEENEFVRTPRAPSEFEGAMDDANDQLAKQGFEPIGHCEFLATRLYTGPLCARAPQRTAQPTARGRVPE